MLFLLRLLVLSRQHSPLGRDALLSSLTCRLGLCALGVHLFFQYTLTVLFGLGFVDLE